jgi:hypothetical protein
MSEPARQSRPDADSGVLVRTETETARGWTFAAQVPRGHDSAEITLTLSWADYEHWSHGAFSPSSVARAVLEALLEAGKDPAERLDASTARRMVRDFDQRVRDAL